MGHMLHRSVNSDHSQKVCLATPAYSGVEAGYAFALFESVKALESAGIASELAIFANDCHVDDSRNRLVRQFLMTDCTDLVFLDSDLRWEGKDLVRLCQFDVDVVGGTYPLKQEQEDFPVHINGNVYGDLYEATSLPTGFLRIKRHVLETLANEAEKYLAKKDNGVPSPLIFERTIENGSRVGGDYTFCRKWAKHGKMYLYPTPTFEHIGSRTWSGSYAHFRKKKSLGVIEAGLEAIREGKETPETLQAMFDEWGNGWAGDSPLLASAVLLSRGKSVIECGSGLSTLCMLAAGASVTSLEHSAEWADKTLEACSKYLTHGERQHLTLVRSPIENGFYSSVPQGDWDLMLCDGPPRQIAQREKAFDISAKSVLLDDFASVDTSGTSYQWKPLTERLAIGYSTGSH